MAPSPNAIATGLSILKSMLKTARPDPHGTGRADHELLATALRGLAVRGSTGVRDAIDDLTEYTAGSAALDPDALTREEALAYWLNLYNAVGLLAAERAAESELDSILRVPGAFTDAAVTVAGEALSLDAIEHGKIRRFQDPRIHAALVCGAISCPTLRLTPYSGDHLDRELDDQMHHFLAAGGVLYNPARNEISLSRVFSWYGADFVRPGRMPTVLPARRRRVLDALEPWLPGELAESARHESTRIAFQSYDWGLRCSVG